MRGFSFLPDGLAVISDLYRDYVLIAGTIAAALFAGSYLLG
ncbi:MAG: hypothetical protein AAGK37_09470 [Pseudomonadota bacterium]